MRYRVCKLSELIPGQLKEAMIDRTPIVICCTTKGAVYAASNRCPHQGAPMSEGKLVGTPAPTNNIGEYNYCREGEILRCPWHGREYDIVNGGQMLSDCRRKLPTFQVKIEGDDVIVIR